MISAFALSFFVNLTITLSAAGAPLDISATDQRMNLGDRVEFFKDPNSSLTTERLGKASETLPWQRNDTPTPNFGYTDATLWFRIQVYNPSNHRVDRLLEVAYPVLDYVDLYVFRSGELTESYQVGDKVPFSQRPVEHRNYVFPVALESGESAELFIRVKSSSSLQVPISIASERRFFTDDQVNLIGMCLYYGMMLVMILYNLFIYVSLKETMYLHYVSFVFSFAAVQLCIQGLPTQYIWPEYPFLQDFGLLFFVPCIVFFAALFGRQFLSLAEHAPLANKIFTVLAYLAALGMVGAFFLPYEVSIKLSILTVIPASLGCLLIGPYLWFKGHSIARFYTLAWASITIATVALALSKFGWVPRTFLTENGLQFGSAAEAVLLSLALADRFNSERNERFKAQELVLSEARQRQIVEQELIYAALHHPLTGAPNRAFFENWFNEQLAQKESGRTMTLGMFHLHRFHEVNKTLGHIQADELLRLITYRLNQFVGSIPGAISLDEKDGEKHYIVAMEGVSYVVLIDHALNSQPMQAMQNIAERVSQTIDFKEMAIDAGCIAGTTIYPEQGVDAPTLLRNAQVAMDMSHRVGKLVVEYSDAINPYNARRLTLAGELRKALENDTLELYFQPKMQTRSGEVTGMEALLRWKHAEYGFIPPDEFIPIAEQTGIINPLTKWVIDRALLYMVQLQNLGKKLTVAVNVSAINLKERNFPETVRSLLKRHDVSPQRLSLEVTESSMMDDPVQALQALQKLNELGIRLSVDDFGTGYSSLSYIRKLPVQEIKIDRSFVMEMDSQENDAIIVETTVKMCHNMGFEVVAEGVETQSSLQRLSEMGCDYLQGYHLSRPLPFDDLVKFINKT